MEEIVKTFRVTMCWDFIVESDTETTAENHIAKLTESFFTETSRMPEFAIEYFQVKLLDERVSGVDAKL